ncbi:hypothetical protein RRG08_035624 [Elysia crispata]|uniref:Uncharacterized protein n=1 Tax=Elysia crispata TaxID=231223 RepID=A0AAE1DB95_9GAST|nr:hypothetical protein RRG08_035624 [Elysia crispata]
MTCSDCFTSLDLAETVVKVKLAVVRIAVPLSLRRVLTERTASVDPAFAVPVPVRIRSTPLPCINSAHQLQSF